MRHDRGRAARGRSGHRAVHVPAPLEPTERIRIAGVPISPERLRATFSQVHDCAEHLLASGALDLHPTYFETVTAMAFLVFACLR